MATGLVQLQLVCGTEVEAARNRKRLDGAQRQRATSLDVVLVVERPQRPLDPAGLGLQTLRRRLGAAYWMPWIGVLCSGDYLSPVEIPMISAGGSLGAYQATLARLATLVEQAETVIPGHGGPLSADQTRRLLGEDSAYLEALERDGDSAPLPRGRATAAQRRIHAENVSRAGGG